MPFLTGGKTAHTLHDMEGSMRLGGRNSPATLMHQSNQFLIILASEKKTLLDKNLPLEYEPTYTLVLYTGQGEH